MLEFRPTNPNRPPDWRWQFGKHLAESGKDLKRVRADRYVGAAAKFSARQTNCQTETDHLELLDSNPDLYEAWALYGDTKVKSARWTVEARLLAGQSADEIAVISQLTSDTVFLYEKVFFNVADKLDRPDYITNNVFTEAAHRGVDSRAYDILWKMFGYWAGSHVLDFLIYKFTKAQKPDGNPTNVMAYLSDDVRGQQVLKAALSMRTMPVTWQTQVEIMNLYYRMLEIEREHEGSGPGGQESFQAGVKAFLSAVPWASGLHQRAGNLVIAQADNQPQALRASELLSIGAGQIPAGLEELMASAKFPEEASTPLPALLGPIDGTEATNDASPEN